MITFSHITTQHLFCFSLAYLIISLHTTAQCPPNIDFERGNFSHWNCYIGSVGVNNGENVISLSRSNNAVSNRQTMYTANSNAGLDPYGGFPVNCPNGSGHSIRLGNNTAGTEAEGISYEFVIPFNQDEYSFVYHYAVVFQDPNH